MSLLEIKWIVFIDTPPYNMDLLVIMIRFVVILSYNLMPYYFIFCIYILCFFRIQI